MYRTNYRKIQHIDENHISVDTKRYVAKPCNTCIGCVFNHPTNNYCMRGDATYLAPCSPSWRRDNTSIIWIAEQGIITAITNNKIKDKISINLENINLPIKICKETKIN